MLHGGRVNKRISLIAVGFLKTSEKSVHRLDQELKLFLSPLLLVNDRPADDNQISDRSRILLDLRVDLRGLFLHLVADSGNFFVGLCYLFAILRDLPTAFSDVGFMLRLKRLDGIFDLYPTFFWRHCQSLSTEGEPGPRAPQVYQSAG
jgi:hypothetical protein